MTQFEHYYYCKEFRKVCVICPILLPHLMSAGNDGGPAQVAPEVESAMLN